MSELERSPPGEACLEREPIRAITAPTSATWPMRWAVVDRGRGVGLDQ